MEESVYITGFFLVVVAAVGGFIVDEFIFCFNLEGCYWCLF